MAESIVGHVNAPVPPSDDARRVPCDRARAGQLLAQGWPAGYVAKQLGVEKQTVERWLDADTDFREAYIEESNRLNRIAEQVRVKILMELPEVVDHAIVVAKDPLHKDFGSMSRYLIDKVLIPQSIQHTRAEHDVAPSFWKDLDARLAAIAPRSERATPKLLEGRAAAESYGARSLRDTPDSDLFDVEPEDVEDVPCES